jgi:hypothetical protein
VKTLAKQNCLDFSAFVAWRNEAPDRRYVSVKLEPGTTEVRVWVYDSVLQIGDFVTCVEEINLEQKKEDRDREEFLKLKQKFEGGSTQT